MHVQLLTPSFSLFCGENLPQTPLSPLTERISNCAQNNISLMLELTRKYSTVVVELTLFAANIVFLVAKIKEDETTASKLYLLINWIGLLYFPYQIHEAIKYAKDSHFACRMNADKFTALSLLRTVSTLNNLLLTSAGCAASVAQELKHKGLMQNIFKLTIPWGEAGLVCGLAIRIFTALADKTTLNCLAEEYLKEELDYIGQLLLDQSPSIPEEANHTLKELNELAVRVRVCMDKDTLITFLHVLKKTKEEENFEDDNYFQKIQDLFTLVKENIKVQIAYTQGARLAVSGINYGLLAASKAHPNSIISASCDLLGQTLYASVLLAEKCLEAKNRRQLNQEFA